MEKTLWKSHWWAYAQTNWLKIVVFGILCFIFLKKDLTFQLNLNAPLKVEEAVDENQPTLKSRKNKPSEKLTDQTTALSSVITNKSSFMDNLTIQETQVERQKKANAPPTGKENQLSMEQLKMSYQLIQLIEQHKLYQFDLAGI